MAKPKLIAILALCALAVAGLSQSIWAASSTCGPASAADGGDWKWFGHDYNNSRNQDQESTISTLQAATLTPIWEFKTTAGDVTATPSVADGMVFVGSNSGEIYALNADSGCQVWATRTPDHGGINASIAVDGGMVFAAVSTVGNPYVLALDEFTGAIKWQTLMIPPDEHTTNVPGITPPTSFADAQQGADAYGSPVVYNGMIFIGVSGGSAELAPGQERTNFHGSFLILDEQSGAILQKTWTVPPIEWQNGYAGISIWSSAAIDTVNQKAYIGTGNPFTYFEQYPTGDSILQVDMNPTSGTFGQITAFFEGTVDTYSNVLSQIPVCIANPGGNEPPWYPQGIGSCQQLDLDFGASPNIFSIGGKMVVGEGQKSGVYWAIDPAKLTPSKPLPDKTNTIPPPQMAQVWNTIVGVPSSVGGIVGSSALDPVSKSIIGPVTTGGYLWSLAQSSGVYRWVQPLLDGVHWGEPVATANGIAYTVDLKGFLDAFDTTTGVQLLAMPIATAFANNPSDAGPTLSWGGVSVARHTVYVSVGLSELPSGYVVAFRPAGAAPAPPAPGATPTPVIPGATTAPAVIAVPGSFSSTYGTPVVVVTQGSTLSFLNLDLQQHNVYATKQTFASPTQTAWCCDTCPYSTDACPLFWSSLADLGGTVPVMGVENLEPGQVYDFGCTIHPGMFGKLVVVPGAP